jgi:2'-5' RNA ligase
MPRLFVALTMPEEVADQLDRLCVGLPGIRWADPGQFHLTLRFIGEVENGTFYEIGEALAASATRRSRSA